MALTGSDEEYDSGPELTFDDDPVFSNIQDRLSQDRHSVMTCDSMGSVSTVEGIRVHDNFTSVPYGFQPRAAYEHNRKNCRLMGVTYNGRSRFFVMVDSKGITTWAKDSLDCEVTHPFTYPKYEYRLITNMIYAKKYNVYFVLWRDFSLRVLNRDFEETCSVSGDMRSVLFMVFNPIKDELITGGVGGTKVWMYHQISDKVWSEIKPMANYRLKLKYELPNVGGSWVKKVDLDLNLQHLYCCSDTDLHAYDLDGNQLFHLERAHQMSIMGCVFSASARLLVTASLDTEVKAWSMTGGLIHTFRGHSRPITHLVLHPDTSALFLTSSQDGSVRLWSLDTMEGLYCIQMSSESVQWMGITDDSFLYAATARNLTVWSLNRVAMFWATARNRITSLRIVPAPEKSTRLVAVGEDNSVRIFSRILQKNLSTVLPPPALSPMQKVKDLCYNRAINVAFLLIETSEIWVYTTRTDPACRMAVWDATEIQRQILFEAHRTQHSEESGAVQKSSSILLSGSTQRAIEGNSGHESISPCHCVCYLDSPAQMWTDEGHCCPLQHHYLLFGLEDGRILFMDPVVKSKKYMELRANKDTILSLSHDRDYQSLISRCNSRGCALFQLWSLPRLELKHQVYCPSDVTTYARLEYGLMTGHENGAVHLHQLSPLDDQNAGPPPWLIRDDESVCVSEIIHTDHRQSVVSVDSCPSLDVYMSASPDGAIKVWDDSKRLLTELSLDDTVTSCCFLNSQADLLVGFKNHIFFIPHSKVCPYLPVEDEDINETESEVFEDPAIKYEGLAENPDPVNLENYLIPFDIEFSKDFIEGKEIEVESPTQEPEEEGDNHSVLSHAPTSIFNSPTASPRRLSDIDLRVSPVNDNIREHYTLPRKNIKKGRARFTDDEGEDKEVSDLMNFDLPRFGVSPGPTPSISPPDTPSTPSFDVSDGEYSLGSLSDDEYIGSDEFEPIDKAEVSSKAKVKKPRSIKVAQIQEEMSTVKTKLSEVSIDAEALIKTEARKRKSETKPPHVKDLRETDHEPTKPEKPTEEKPREVKPARVYPKKEFRGERKLPKRAEARPLTPPEVTEVRPRSEGTKKKQVKAKVTKKPQPVKTKSVVNKPPQQTEKTAESKVKVPVKISKAPREPAPLPSVPEPEIQIQSSPSPAGRKGSGRRMELISDNVQSSLMAARPDIGASPTADILKLDDADTDTENAGEALEHTVTDGMRTESGIKVEFDSTVAPSSRVQSAASRTFSSPGPDSLEYPDGTKYGGNISVYMSERIDSNIKDSGIHSRAQSGTTRASTAKSRSRSSGSPADYEELMDILTSETEQYIKDLTDDSESVGFGTAEGRRSGLSRPGSDWSRPGSSWSRTGSRMDAAFLEEFDEELKNLMEKGIPQRPLTSAQPSARPNTPSGVITSRPHTADNEKAKEHDLEGRFSEAFRRFQAKAGVADPLNALYKNSGTEFEPEWQDRAIERHLLLKLQRMVRAKSARERRQLLEHRQQQKRHSLLGHTECDQPAGILAGQKSGRASRAQTAMSYARTPKTFGNQPRPHTASPRLPPNRKSAEYRKLKQRSDQAAEMPFRFHMKEEEPGATRKKKSIGHIDPRMLDPTDPSSFILRGSPSRSIPSKCSRYMLVSRPPEAETVVTPLEEQLIMHRFPEWVDKWLPQAGHYKNYRYPHPGMTLQPNLSS